MQFFKRTNSVNKNCGLTNPRNGFTLLETLLSLAIFSVALAGTYQLVEGYQKSTVQSLAAQQQRTFAQATQGYIKDNYQAIAAQLSANAIYKVSTSDLIADNRLPSNYSGQNAYKQNICAVVRLVPGLTPDSLPQLQSLVVAEGGQAVDDVSLGNLAAQMGGAGGGVYQRNPAKVEGAYGAWSLQKNTFSGLANQTGTNCSGQAGNVNIETGRPVSALWFENGDVSTSFLSRDEVPGLPSLNTMQTPLVLGEGAQAVDGAACKTTQKGAIARDSSGRILSCQTPDFKWRQVASSYWSDPVEQSSWLSGFTSVLGQVRLDQETGQANYYNGTPGSGWSNLFVSPAGNLSIGTQGVNATGTDNAYYGIGSTPQNVTGSGNLHVGNSSGGKSVAGWGNTLLGNNIAPESTGSTTNTMVGYNVGTRNQITTGNTFVGAYSGAMNQNGNYNTLVGTGAGAQTLSSNNNFFGFNSGYSNRTGLGNAYFGDWAGRSNATGSQNSYFGQYSGSDTNVTNSIAIGYGAVVSTSNAVQLGRNSTAYQIQLGGSGSTVSSTNINATAFTGTTFTGGTFSGAAFNVTSDGRLKTDVIDTRRGLDFINKLRPVEYGLITDGGRKRQGFIAQEVEAIDPSFSAVNKPADAEKDHYSLNYIEFIPAIVKSIQQLDLKASSVGHHHEQGQGPGDQSWVQGLLALTCLGLTLALLSMRKTMKHMDSKIKALELSQRQILDQFQGSNA